MMQYSKREFLKCHIAKVEAANYLGVPLLLLRNFPCILKSLTCKIQNVKYAQYNKHALKGHQQVNLVLLFLLFGFCPP
jgi:hypothetical protein